MYEQRFPISTDWEDTNGKKDNRKEQNLINNKNLNKEKQMSFQAKSAQVLSRQLEAQSLVCTINAVAATSDLPAVVSIANGTIADTVVTLDIGEPISKCYAVQVLDRATGAIVPLEAVPSLAVANKISVQINGTGLTDLAVIAHYKVTE